MPLYEFECDRGHRLEKLFSISACPHRIVCDYLLSAPITGNLTQQTCGLLAEKVFSTPANINLGKPTIVFINKKSGEVEVAVTDRDEPRPGFTREELRNPIERSKFEKNAQAYTDEKNAILTEKLKQDHAETRKNRHADIESRMNTFPNDGTREFLKKAMQRKSKRKFPEKQSQVKLTVNHTDSSNLIK